MDYKIKYLPLAVQDLRDIAQYLSGFYPKTAPRVLREILCWPLPGHAHMTQTAVTAGKAVTAGQGIGYAGNTGDSTGFPALL